MKRLLLVLACCAVADLTAQAGTITAVTTFALPVASTGTITAGATPAPNNDNVAGASANVIPVLAFLNSPGPIEIEFAVANSGGATEYRITQALVNNSGSAWLGFRFELGFGTGASFVASTPADALDFDAPAFDPQPVSSVFPLLDAQADLLLFSGASLSPVGTATFAFAIDVPDLLATLHPGGINRFTLRQIPITAAAPVPEPATALLLVAALASLVALRAARRGRR